MTVCCANCIYWVNKVNIQGECRRRSPEFNPSSKKSWPKTLHTDWCGEFEKRPSNQRKNSDD